ncbi:MAG: hypothetical protein EHM48_00455, partial [Planctomycetaceae bacterium]
MRNGQIFLAVAVMLACAGMAEAQQAASSSATTQEAQAVYKLKIISDVTPDVTSVDALLSQIIKPGMTDEQKCAAAWQVVFQGRFWSPSSR